jgi:hypothetical protein
MQPFALTATVEKEVNVTPYFREQGMRNFDFFIEEGTASLEKIGVHGLCCVAAGKPEKCLDVVRNRIQFAEGRFARATSDVGGSDVPGTVSKVC